MALGDFLLGNLLESTHLPVNYRNAPVSGVDTSSMSGINPDEQVFQAPDGTYTNSPVRRMGMWGHVFSPNNAATIDSLADRYQNAMSDAMLQRAVDRGVASRNWDTLTPNQQSLFSGNKQNAITTTGGNFTGENMEGQGGALADINLGNPLLKAQAEHNIASAQSLISANEAKKASMAGLYGTPEEEAIGENLGSQLNTAMNSGHLALAPQRLYGEGLGLGNDISLAQGLRERIPNINATEGANAQYGRGIAETQLGQLPTTKDTLKNELTKEWYNSRHMATPSRFGLNVDNGHVQFGVNPMGATESQLMNMSLGQMGQTPGMTTQMGPSGRAIMLPSTETAPAMQQGVGQSINEPSQKEVKHLQEEASGYENNPYMQEALQDAKTILQQHGPDSKEYSDAVQRVHEVHHQLLKSSVKPLPVGSRAGDFIRSVGNALPITMQAKALGKMGKDAYNYLFDTQ